MTQREFAEALSDQALLTAIDQAVADSLYVKKDSREDALLSKWLRALIAERARRGYCTRCRTVKHEYSECPLA